MNAATILRSLADLLDDHQLPAPTAVSLYDKPRVQVPVKEIGWWLTAMEIGEPSWHGEAGGMLFAEWPDGTFDGHDFVLVAVSTANVAVA